MIRLHRTELPRQTTASMTVRTRAIGRAEPPARPSTARGLWSHSTVRRTIPPALLNALTAMAPGHERCMYCGDDQGSDIDHFEAVTLGPLRTFDWANHFLEEAPVPAHESWLRVLP